MIAPHSPRPWALLLLTLIFFGCGDETGGPCGFDSNCPTNQACVTAFCRPLCRNDSDCRDIQLPDENAQGPALCRPFIRVTISQVPINVCAPKEEVSITPPDECTTDQQCINQLDNDHARCSLLNTCIVPPEVTSILLRDQSTTGATILGVQLERSGQTFATHLIEDYTPAGQLSPPPPISLPDQPTLPPLSCPTPPARHAPLGGQGGQLRLHFKQPDGQRIALQRGDRVVVFEQGSQCTADQTDEAIQAFLCTSRAGDRPQSDDTQCGLALGASQTGRSTWVIP